MWIPGTDIDVTQKDASNLIQRIVVSQQPGSSRIVIIALEKAQSKDDQNDNSEVLLSSLLSIHRIQNGLPFGSVALAELLNLPLHHRIQGTQTQLQLLKIQVLQLVC